MSWNKNSINRRFAKAINSEDAYVTGYFYIYFLHNDKVTANIKKVYSRLFNNVTTGAGDDEQKNASGNDLLDMKLLSATCTAVSTLPGGTMNKASITALGGTKWGAITNFDYGDSTTLRFVELAELPVSKYISAWFNLIRDRNTGLSPIRTASSNLADKAYGKNEFSCDLCYFTTKPNGSEIEFACVMEGVYPLKDPMDLFAHDLTAVDSLQLDIDFHVDSIWWDSKAEAQALKLLTSNHIDGTTKYYEHQKKG